VLITGGAGFIGCNLAHRLLRMGKRVLIMDNLSRTGVDENLRWLRQNHDERLVVEIGDVRDIHTLRSALRHAERVYHLSAQVAVTTSLIHPLDDFDVNLRGTMNLLECLRGLPKPPPVLFTSTNKVYGALGDLQLEDGGERYEPSDKAVRRNGIAEDRPLDFHSPYGCSKGAADQYVLDFAHTLGIPGIVFRMSCVYGPHQFGTEEQGWVAHFLIRALEDEPITLYGDGRQVRDLLYVDDLVNALLLAQDHIDELSGQAFNIGGGPANTMSLLELIDFIGRLTGREPRVEFDDWRLADQKYYVSNTGKFSRSTGWQPATSVRRGVELLHRWLMESRFQGLSFSSNRSHAAHT
jgi:CDP-paratose 2-epimerase